MHQSRAYIKVGGSFSKAAFDKKKSTNIMNDDAFYHLPEAFQRLKRRQNQWKLHFL